MADFDAISDQAYVAAGADFAFVLTRRGRLVTRHAPRDMPQEGRGRIVEAALGLRSGGRLGHVELPREDLVPYGGAAPVEVYFGVAAEAILCVVMPSWADRAGVLPALEEGLRALDQGDEEAPAESRPVRKGPRRSPSRPRMEAAPPSSRRPPVAEIREPPPSTRAVAAFCAQPSAPPLASPSSPSSTELRAPAAPPARKRSAVAGLVALANGSPARSLARPVMLRDAPPPPAASPRPSASLPDIRIGEATLGRESLAAIERELGVRPSLPEIRVGAAPVGRDTLVAIEAETMQPARPGSAPDAVRVDLVSISRDSLLDIAAEEARQATAGPRPSMPLIRNERLTRPWVEAPEDARRRLEAAKRARSAAPPELDVELIEPDTEVFEAALRDRRRH